MRVLVLAAMVAAPALARDAGVRGVDGPTAGTRCSGPDDCKVDVASGTCSIDGGVSSWPAPSQGGACGCVKNVCHSLWIEPVSCQTNADCAVATEPVVHPTRAAPTKKKPRPFRPCKDGEREPACIDAVCTIRKWKC